MKNCLARSGCPRSATIFPARNFSDGVVGFVARIAPTAGSLAQAGEAGFGASGGGGLAGLGRLGGLVGLRLGLGRGGRSGVAEGIGVFMVFSDLDTPEDRGGLPPRGVRG